MVAILQASVLPYLSLAGVKPDLMLLVVISWGLLRGLREGLLWAFVGGLCLDLFSGAPFGVSALALLVAALLAGAGASGNLFQALHLAWPGAAVFFATLIYDFTFLTLLQIMGRPVAWGASLLKIVLPAALLNAFLAVPVYLALRGLHERTAHEQLEW